jgi:hypothetical protein
MTRYWFKPKSYGYGATPITREGWVVTFVAAAAMAGSVVVMELLMDKSDLVAWLVWVALIAAATWWFIQLSRRRTDGEWRWRWGNGSDTPKT